MKTTKNIFSFTARMLSAVGEAIHSSQSHRAVY